MDNNCGIYKIQSPTKRIYIGQSVDLKRRISEYKRCHCKDQPVLFNSIKKYGWDKHKFEVLAYCDINKLNELERYYQELYSVLNESGMNLCLVKVTDRSGRVSEEVKKKISASKKGKPRGPLSQECKDKMSLSRRGRKMPPRSDQWREKCRLRMTGRRMTEETKESIRLKTIKAVFQFDLDGIFIKKFDSIKDAAKDAGVSPCYLVNYLNSSRSRSCGGFLWSRDQNLIPKLRKNNNIRMVISDSSLEIMTIKEALLLSNFSYSSFYNQLAGYNINKTGFKFYSEDAQ